METHYIQCELRKDVVQALIAQGALHLEDVRVLNAQSRSRLRKVLMALLTKS